MEAMKKASSSLTRLVSDLLDVARLESGTVKVSVHPTDLISIIQDSIIQFKGEAEKKSVNLTFNYESDKGFPFIMSDSERLKEVFSNLISNAIKFNKAGGEVKITVEEDNGFLTTRVSDTGLGISKEELPKLFTKFWRAHPEIEGTGLGLWLSRQLVIRMNGKMSVESIKDAGTTVAVQIPIAKENGLKTIPKSSLGEKKK